MYQKLIDRLHKSLKDAGNVDGYESRKLRYMIELLVSELSKILLLSIAFLIIGQWLLFLYAMIALMLIRPFTGGLHFKTYGRCLLFTFMFFGVVILAYHFVTITPIVYAMIVLLCLALTYRLGPIQSPNRPPLDEKGIKTMARRTTIILLGHFLLYILWPHLDYFALSGYVMLFQFTQLTIAKGVRNYEKHVQSTS